MEPRIVTTIEIKSYPGRLALVPDFGVCKTFTSEKGVIRTTFERYIKYSDQLLPVSVTYKSILQNNLATEIFEDFNLLELKPSESDMPYPDGGSGKMTIYTNGFNRRLKE